MQNKLQRLNIIIRDTYASGELIHEEYIEATELLIKLSNELKILNIPCVTQRSESLSNFHKWLGDYNQLTTHSYNTKYIIETYEKLLNDG